MRILRFFYINSYSFLLSALGVLVIMLPLYKITWILFAVQCLLAIKILTISGRLFSAWDVKKREIALLTNRNRQGFRPETFKMYMQAPCSRLVVRAALNDLDLRIKYKELLIYKRPFWDAVKPVEHSIYINEEYL